MTADNYLRLRTALAGFQRTPAQLSDEERQALEAQVARASALERKVLASPAAQDVHVPAAVVEQAVQTIASRYDSVDAFTEDMACNGLDQVSLRSALERELKVEAVLDRLTAAHCAVSDDEAAIYYYQHPERFTRPEIRTARHILITVNAAYAENRPERALPRLQQIRRELTDPAQQFEAMARRHSECPSAMEGGRLGRVKPGMLYPALDAELFAMAVGEVSDVVESEIGLHVLWCEAIEPGGVVPFAEVCGKIIDHLSERKRKQFLREWFANP
ncbi:MAG: nitrogen fixation protein NifM [Gammaproteobacteria bacterium HGW-Gammaproteobacteria-1]|jgi:nitrogen fixation protein NifM|nr:MAG: nitrogen fixation protein NifM [Gammaproteobacteria bacterium HGW-Gammaproteobacteria-1]